MGRWSECRHNQPAQPTTPCSRLSLQDLTALLLRRPSESVCTRTCVNHLLHSPIRSTDHGDLVTGIARGVSRPAVRTNQNLLRSRGNIECVCDLHTVEVHDRHF